MTETWRPRHRGRREQMNVPETFSEFRFEYRLGYEYGQTCAKGETKYPRIRGPFQYARMAAWRAGRDDAMIERGLITREYAKSTASIKRYQNRKGGSTP